MTEDVTTRFGHADALYRLGFYNVIDIQNNNKIRVDKNSKHIVMELSYTMVMETNDD